MTMIEKQTALVLRCVEQYDNHNIIIRLNEQMMKRIAYASTFVREAEAIDVAIDVDCVVVPEHVYEKTSHIESRTYDKHNCMRVTTYDDAGAFDEMCEDEESYQDVDAVMQISLSGKTTFRVVVCWNDSTERSYFASWSAVEELYKQLNQ